MLPPVVGMQECISCERLCHSFDLHYSGKMCKLCAKAKEVCSEFSTTACKLRCEPGNNGQTCSSTLFPIAHSSTIPFITCCLRVDIGMGCVAATVKASLPQTLNSRVFSSIGRIPILAHAANLNRERLVCLPLATLLPRIMATCCIPRCIARPVDGCCRWSDGLSKRVGGVSVVFSCHDVYVQSVSAITHRDK